MGLHPKPYLTPWDLPRGERQKFFGRAEELAVSMYSQGWADYYFSVLQQLIERHRDDRELREALRHMYRFVLWGLPDEARGLKDIDLERARELSAEWRKYLAEDPELEREFSELAARVNAVSPFQPLYDVASPTGGTTGAWLWHRQREEWRRAHRRWLAQRYGSVRRAAAIAHARKRTLMWARHWAKRQQMWQRHWAKRSRTPTGGRLPPWRPIFVDEEAHKSPAERFAEMLSQVGTGGAGSVVPVFVTNMDGVIDVGYRQIQAIKGIGSLVRVVD